MNQRPNKPQQGNQPYRPKPEEVREAIEQGGEKLVNLAKRIGETVVKDVKRDERLSTSQIRNIFGFVKRLEMRGFDRHKFAMLKPRLVYAAARAGTEGAEIFRDAILAAIDAVSSDESKFRKFVDFFEAILAYHKAAEVEESRKRRAPR
jgi:CRISPR-associated protein Csm2